MRRSRGASLLIWLLLAMGMLGLAFCLDGAAAEWMREIQNRDTRNFMRAVSWWGDWYTHVVAGLLAAGVAHLLRQKRWVRIFIAMLVACAIAGAVTRVVKVSTGRSRPAVQVDAGWNGPRLSSKYHAFPSGHTAATTAFFGMLALASWRAGLLLLPIPLLIGFARLYVGAHHLSDVIGAAILGLLVALLVSRSRFFEILNQKS